ncbi:IclR family transcriptional regulator [Bordetella bronchiseptica]|uniref:IclR family transcriptional regulator n=1 Tax=Bordetella bronchiseptica TaxID=518 RepID=UPI00045A18C6|nr:IclR family transcriptional regulator [Bordetella bronchiseptica]KCV24557.1 transcriptional regulator, IclR family, C-terminal domain protein [Bordetella bronchiseptica 00-P-2730]KDD50833.1 transcriptional regulator, IclR family, C-terminal domain protein [Bordetella bronchiseptica OSU553]KAK54177.1 transcriptional regulator, IclR family, C-terminal domain protein [Bordetella bronchiseptica OSU054]KAK71345.1 transcriptional regulator, IclR family, C-terminal domain protein [Bordetella bronch
MEEATVAADGSKTRKEEGGAESGGSQVMTKGLRVLSHVAHCGGEIGVRELARDVGLPVAVVHRLVSSLSELNYLEKNPESGKYRIGYEAFEVGRTYLRSARIETCAPPVLRNVVDAHRLNAFLGVMRDLSVIYLITIQDYGHYDIRIAPGSEVPLATTAMGKVLLADLADDEILEKLGQYAEKRFSAFDISKRDTVIEEIVQIRQQGYAVSEDGSFRGTVSVAAPVYNFTGRVIAAVSVGRPTQISSGPTVESMIECAVEAAGRISACLGAQIANQRRGG